MHYILDEYASDPFSRYADRLREFGGAAERQTATVTFFPNQFARSATREEITLEELRVKILETTARAKADLPWLKMAKFGHERSSKRSLRHDANVLTVTGVEVDYDGKQVPFDEAIAVLRRSSLTALAYTSPSHTLQAPKWRLLCPTSRELPTSERAKLVARVNGVLGGVVAPESFTLSQSYFFGSVNGSPDHSAEIVYGDHIDLRDDLDQIAIWSRRDQGERNGNAFLQTAGEQSFKPSIDVQAALREMKYGDHEKGVHLTQLRTTASLAMSGMDEHAATTLVLDATRNLPEAQGWNWTLEERNIRRMYRDAVEKFGARPNAAIDLVDLTDARGEQPRPVWREQFRNGLPKNTLHNARVALDALGVKCRQDIFQSRLFIGYDGNVSHELQQLVGEVSDDAIIALRRVCSDEFGANFSSELMMDAIRSIAMEHQYNPVCDLLDEAEANWDGEPRLDRMAVDYLNAADTLLNSAFIRKTMIAAVRRARRPGCKFDTITVLESPEGWNKSGYWRVIAGDAYYSDESIIGQRAREVQEQLATVWIHENAELAGMRKQEVEVVKAYASRQEDIARPAYGRVVKRQPRHSIDVGTTNSDTYLQSQTGNRRFWPIRILAPIDLDKLKRDRLQLLGEAAAYESRGEEITLDPSLWGAAGIEQDARRIRDPWEDTLDEMPTHATTNHLDRSEFHYVRHGEAEPIGAIRIIHRIGQREYVATGTVVKYVLQVPNERLTAATTMRLGTVMRQIGWERDANKITIDGKQVRGYWRPARETTEPADGCG